MKLYYLQRACGCEREGQKKYLTELSGMMTPVGEAEGGHDI